MFMIPVGGGNSSAKDMAEAFELFQKMSEKKKEDKKEEPKPTLASYVRTYLILTMVFPLVAMLFSYMVVKGSILWATAMQGMLKIP